MTINYEKAWSAMNHLEQIITKISNSMEIMDSATDAIEQRKLNKAVALNYAAYDYLQVILNEFDETFRNAWNETIKKLNTSSPIESWTTEIQKDLIDEELIYIELPKELCNSANLNEGDRLVWDLHSGNEDTLTIKKIN